LQSLQPAVEEVATEKTADVEIVVAVADVGCNWQNLLLVVALTAEEVAAAAAVG